MTLFNLKNRLTTRTDEHKTVARLTIPLLGTLFVLSACSHPNPLLKNQTPEGLKATADYLIKVAKTVDGTLDNPADFSGNGAALYEDCMDGKYSERECQPLYQAMSQYIAATQPTYHLRQSDIEDKAMWKQISKVYEETRFYDSPDLPMEF